jgi:hypothetical protein
VSATPPGSVTRVTSRPDRISASKQGTGQIENTDYDHAGLHNENKNKREKITTKKPHDKKKKMTFFQTRVYFIRIRKDYSGS